MKKLIISTATFFALILICNQSWADLFADKDFDGSDLAAFMATYGSTNESPDYNPDCDFIDNGDVDKVDLGSFASFFGKMNIIEFKLAWDANNEPYLDGYEIYIRDGVSGSGYQMIGNVYIDELVDPDNPVITVTNSDNNGFSENPTINISELFNNSKYYFAVAAFDTQRHISELSGELCTKISAYSVTECRVAEIIGCSRTFQRGVGYWDESRSKWTEIISKTPDGDIAAGDFTGDGKADIAGIFYSELWYIDGATLNWTRVPGIIPDRLTAGDVTGDGRFEIIGTWNGIIWYWDESRSKWTEITSKTPDGDIAAGDFTGDGKADIAGIFYGNLYYLNGATLVWTKIPGIAPDRLAVGDITGD
jgi:hypothetical protein